MYRQADAEKEAGNARQCEGRAQQAERPEGQRDVEAEGQVGDQAPGPVERQHEQHDEGKAGKARVEAHLDGIAAEVGADRSEEHTSELQSLMRISYAVFCLKKKTIHRRTMRTN